jgi:hypothetical protein
MAAGSTIWISFFICVAWWVFVAPFLGAALERVPTLRNHFVNKFAVAALRVLAFPLFLGLVLFITKYKLDRLWTFAPPDPQKHVTKLVVDTGNRTPKEIFKKFLTRIDPNCTTEWRHEPDTCHWNVYSDKNFEQIENDNGYYQLILQTKYDPKQKLENVKVFCKYSGPIYLHQGNMPFSFADGSEADKKKALRDISEIQKECRTKWVKKVKLALTQ